MDNSIRWCYRTFLSGWVIKRVDDKFVWYINGVLFCHIAPPYYAFVAKYLNKDAIPKYFITKS
jgi:hypothetical protein